MAPLPRELRRLLENVIVAARDAAEDAARAALRALSVDREEAHSGISGDDRALRVALRARARQLGGFDLLVAEVAYEQWHRMLFARFLAENDLLMHPSGVAVTLAECADLAPSEGETDEWMLAARYASHMLPGIFRNGDPSVRVRFARNDIALLEKLLASLQSEAFTADDALGWVYQFWQTVKKREVNASERKIGGADLPAVTQLFTEPYMVAFLLENSLGAWWASRHPDSPLIREFAYLRLADGGAPSAGTFEGWPDAAAEITVMDPCCGSGHFLVAAFELLRRMREEEEGLSRREAADAVLASNLFGLELDGRCVQIAVFALALAAWKAGGFRELPPMKIACSGVPARGTEQEWKALAQGDDSLTMALERLHHLFRDADTLGSLIDPRRAAESDTLLGVEYDEVAPTLHEALRRFGGDDPAQQVLAQAAEDVATAAELLAGKYHLVATNPPYLGAGKQADNLREYCARWHAAAKPDLAFAMLERWAVAGPKRGVTAMVTPQTWMFMPAYRQFRKSLASRLSVSNLVQLGEHAFESPAAAGALVSLVIVSQVAPGPQHEFIGLDLTMAPDPQAKETGLRTAPLLRISQQAQEANPDGRFVLEVRSNSPQLSLYCQSFLGLGTGDFARLGRVFWELPGRDPEWSFHQGAAPRTMPWGGLSGLVAWDEVGGVSAVFRRTNEPEFTTKTRADNRRGEGAELQSR